MLGERPLTMMVSDSKPGTRAVSGLPSTAAGRSSSSPTSSTEKHQRLIYSAYSALRGRRCRSLALRVSWPGSPEVLKMKMLSGPSSSKKTTTPWRTPVRSEATVTTVVMPITMPKMVSSERKRCVHTAWIAI